MTCTSSQGTKILCLNVVKLTNDILTLIAFKSSWTGALIAVRYSATLTTVLTRTHQAWIWCIHCKINVKIKHIKNIVLHSIN